MNRADFVVVGAGIAGASAAYHLAERGSVVLIEREDTPGYHTTGRSAAMFTEAYGGPIVRAITCGSRSFFESPPTGFSDIPLLSPRGMVFIGRADQEDALAKQFAECHALVPSIRRENGAALRDWIEVLRADYVHSAVVEPDSMEIDVAALHQAYLKGARARGGKLIVDAELTGLSHDGTLWVCDTRAGVFAAPALINAAGAWCDVVAAMAGVKPIGLVPKRRTAFIFDAPEGSASDTWPLVADVDEDFYFKPDAGRVMGSPADETPMDPCDVQPDELDIAIGADRIMKATTIEIRHIRNKWAGLRSFVRDKSLVAGFDPDAPGFFWLAGQGGYGIQTSPAMGRITAALATGEAFPEDIAAFGVDAARLSPARLR